MNLPNAFLMQNMVQEIIPQGQVQSIVLITLEISAFIFPLLRAGDVSPQ